MRYVILILVLFCTMFSWGQQLDLVFRGTLINLDAGKKEGAVKVELVQNGSVVSSSSTASNGKFKITSSVDQTKPFEIKFSKAGFIGKMMRFNFNGVNEEDIPPGGEFFDPFEIKIFKERDNADFSFLKTEPVAQFDWNSAKLSPRLNSSEANRIGNKILTLLAEADKNKAEAEMKYNAAIKEADGFYNAQSYEEALTKYEEAVGYKPQEPYPNERIVELDALIQAQKSADLAEKQENEEYYNLIEAGDNLRDQDNLEGAIAKYKEAITKKDEQYPKDQIATLSKTLEDRQKAIENKTKYDALIKQADGFLKQNSVRAAKDKYTEASKLMPQEQYPKDKLAEIEGKMQELAEKEAIKKQYDDAVNAADALFSVEDFAGAKEKYNEALTFESSSTYVKARITICDEKILEAKNAAETEAKIAELLKSGAESMNASQWDAAKTSYESVLALDNLNETAITKLEEVEKALENAKNQALQEEKYAKLVSEGESANNSGELETALSKYEEAQTIKVEPNVTTTIQEIKAKIADNKAAAEKKEQYDQLIADGESALLGGDLQAAKIKFEGASKIDPNQELPKNKLAEIETLMANEAADKEKAANYQTAIESADNAYNLSNWEEAKAKYQEAISIDDSKPYPSERITEIDKLIKEKELADLKAAEDAEAKAKFDAVISEANTLFIANDYIAAKAKYEEAQSIDPSQTITADKIAEIEGILASIEADKKAADEAQAMNEAYEDAISAANTDFEKGNLEKAKSGYEAALDIDSSKSFPKERIVAIDTQLIKIAEDEAKHAQIEDLLDEGAKLVSDEKFEDAKSVYEEILTLDPGNTDAQAQLTKVNGELALLKNDAEKEAEFVKLKEQGFSLAEGNQFEQAKQKLNEALSLKDDPEIRSKIDAIDKAIAQLAAQQGIDDNYNALILAGESAQSSGDYKAAITKYEEALSLKPNEAMPQAKIQELQSLIENEKALVQLDEEYDDLITQANTQVISKDYESAISTYQEALNLKPDETMPQMKIEELQALIDDASKADALDEKYNTAISDAAEFESIEDYIGAIKKYKTALELKPNESLPKSKIAALQSIIDAQNEGQAKLDADYNKLMKEGDQMIADKLYLEAIKKFNAALSLKPKEQAPVDKAAEAERLEKAKGREGDAQYEKILTVAEKKINASEYDRATELVNRAMKLKPDDSRPQALLNRINAIKELENDYDNAITQGAVLMGAKKYQEAKLAYQKANDLKPNEPEPIQKLTELDALIGELADASQKESLYKDYMTKGGLSFGKKDYQGALGYYQNALSVKANDTEAASKISEIQQIIDDLANANERDLKLKNEFDAIINDADGNFANELYLNAKKKYEEALILVPSSTYAKTQIKECERLERAKGKAEAEKEYRKIITAADKNFDKASYDKAINYYNRALSIKNEDPYPKQKLAEINAILNPVSVESSELEDLGDPFDNSLMDGGFVLQQAEAERKTIKKTKINRKQSKILAEASELSSSNTASHRENSNEIYKVQMKISRDAGQGDLNRQATVDALRLAQDELANEERSNGIYEYGENISDQGTLDIIQEESTLDYGERHSVYEENTKIMTGYNEALAKANIEKVLTDYDRNVESNGTLAEVKGAISTGMQENFVERAKTGQQVLKVQKSAGRVNTEISGDR